MVVRPLNRRPTQSWNWLLVGPAHNDSKWKNPAKIRFNKFGKFSAYNNLTTFEYKGNGNNVNLRKLAWKKLVRLHQVLLFLAGFGNLEPMVITVIQVAKSRSEIGFDIWLLETCQLCLIFIRKGQFLLKKISKATKATKATKVQNFKFLYYYHYLM